VTSINLYITSGLPYRKRVVATLPSVRDWWLTDADFEVFLQIREEKEITSPLVLDLSDYLTVSMTDEDTVYIILQMTGAQTRLLLKGGYYDLIISDPEVTDARAYPLIKGRVIRKSLVTAPEASDP